MAINKDSKSYVVIVALVLCLACSVVVSAAAVMLRPTQDVNRKLDRQTNVLRVAGLYEPGIDVAQTFNERVEPRVISLETGEYVDGIDPAEFDMYQAAKDPNDSLVLSREQDVASIKRKPKHALVYLVRGPDGAVKNYVLPVNGYGLWSTLYGYLALEADGNTVAGITFYQHAETPGLGGEVDNPNWKAQWPGKKVYGDKGQVELHLVKGGVDPSAPDAEHKVDALAGATLTSNGVSNLVRFWMSEQGYKPFLDRVAKS